MRQPLMQAKGRWGSQPERQAGVRPTLATMCMGAAQLGGEAVRCSAA